MRKPDFRYTDSTIPLLLKSNISSFYPASETVQASLYQTGLETRKTGFLLSRLIYLKFPDNTVQAIIVEPLGHSMS